MTQFACAVSCSLALTSAACGVTVSERMLAGAHRDGVTPMLPSGIVRSNVAFKTPDGVELRGWRLRRKDSTRTVVFFHGNGGGVVGSTVSLYLLTEIFDADVIALDARGFGFSDGKAAFDPIIDDSVSVYDFAASLYERNRPIVVVGQSMGAASATRVASTRAVAGVVLLGALSSLNDLVDAIKQATPWFVSVSVDPKLRNLRASPLDDLKHVNAPLLIVRADKDVLSTEAASTRILNAAASTRKDVCVVPGEHDAISPSHKAVRKCLEPFAATIPKAETPLPLDASTP